MILLTDASSIIEAIYLDQRLVNSRSEARIIVNPDNPYYSGKTIWVNSPHYDLSVLSELSKFNDIKSRIRLNNAHFNYKFLPYRNDRIKNIKINLYESSGYNINKLDMTHAILFTDFNGKLATKPPLNLEHIETRSNLTSYELYMIIIENSLNGK